MNIYHLSLLAFYRRHSFCVANTKGKTLCKILGDMEKEKPEIEAYWKAPLKLPSLLKGDE